MNVWLREIRRLLSGRLWVRSALYGMVALVLAVAAPPITNYLPGRLTSWVKPDSLQSLLEIVASSMLLVTTFSLGTMVTAYTAAATLATPRASKVLIDDPVSQRVLSTFIGAFVFSIVGLIALALGYYDEQGQTLLLFATVLVIGAVVVTLFGWVEYLSNLVRLGSVLNKVETAIERAVLERRDAPFMRARPLGDAAIDARGDALPGWYAVRPETTGYVAEIDLDTIERIAAEKDGEVRIAALPGKLVNPVAALAHSSFALAPDEARELAKAFSIMRERSIDQDPRFGLIMLAEVASRALSPGMNDPGTAIGVISRLERLLVAWAEPPDAAPEVRFPHVAVQPITAEDLFQDAFGPLARDGAAMVEVGVRLQKTLAALAGLGRADLAEAAIRQSERALKTAEAKLTLESDRANLAVLAARVREAAEAGRTAAASP